MAFVRGALRTEGANTAAELQTLRDGRPVKIAGLVLFRQRPGTAKGTIFITIEDETGTANLIVWPKIAAQYRRAVFGAKALLCEGVLQKKAMSSMWLAAVSPTGRPCSRTFSQPIRRRGSAAQPGWTDYPQLRRHHPDKRKSVDRLWTNSLKSRDFRMRDCCALSKRRWREPLTARKDRSTYDPAKAERWRANRTRFH
jgi:error-prone DNA polymerase